MQVKVYYSELPAGISATQDFSIDVINRCLLDTLTINAAKFPITTLALTYYVKDAAKVLSWTDADATSTLSLTTCGTRAWTVTKTDGSAIDTIFTALYTAAINSISVQTTLFSKAGTYDMKVKVWYTDLPSVTTTQDFTILVTSPCLTDTLTISTAKFNAAAFSYNIRNAAGVFSWLDTDVTSSSSLTNT